MRINLRRYAEQHGATLSAKWPDWWVLLRGWLVQCDYSQLENRIITLLSDDKQMLEWYSKGLDVHSLTGAKLLNMDIEEFQPKHDAGDKECILFRRLAKTVRYGMNYMGSAQTIWGQVITMAPRVTLGQVESMCKTFRTLHPDIIKFHQKNMKIAHRRDYLEAPISGRRLYFHGKVDLTLLANWPIQTTGADVINAATIRWDELKKTMQEGWRKWERLIAQVHDSLVVTTPNPFGSIKHLTDAMSVPVDIDGRSLDLPVDPEVGMHLASTKDSPFGLRGVSTDDPQGLFDWMLETGLGTKMLTPAVF